MIPRNFAALQELLTIKTGDRLVTTGTANWAAETERWLSLHRHRPTCEPQGSARDRSRSRGNCDNLTGYRVGFAVVWVLSAFWVRKTWEIHRYRTDYEFPNRRAVPNDLLTGGEP